MKIKKRDGSIVEFDQNKIAIAIGKAIAALDTGASLLVLTGRIYPDVKFLIKPRWQEPLF